MKINKTTRPGFTIIEALAASIILAMAIAIICSLSGKSLSQTRHSLDYEQAWQMMDRQFILIEQMGIKSFILKGQTEGVIAASVDEETGEAKYQWKAEVESLLDDKLYQITLTIVWGDGKHIAAATMINND